MNFDSGVSNISAIALPISIVIVLLPSDAAMTATDRTDDVAAVDEDRFSYSLLFCWSQPATNLALNF